MDPAETEQPPRDSASIVIVRDGKTGLEVLLARRNQGSRVLANTYVFPGGKLEYADAAPEALALLDQPVERLHVELGETDLPAVKAASLYVAAVREAAEESGLMFLKTHQTLTQPEQFEIARRVRAHDAWAEICAESAARLDCGALVPWSRWITPRGAAIINRRFDTRFFLARKPAGQEVHPDGFEINEMHWLAPRVALQRYQAREIELIPPQIVSLMHLAQFHDADEALREARSRLPPLIEPKMVRDGDNRVMCYPGDPAHPVRQRGFPPSVPTRMIFDGHHFEPPHGYDAFLQSL